MGMLQRTGEPPARETRASVRSEEVVIGPSGNPSRTEVWICETSVLVSESESIRERYDSARD